MNPKQSFTKMLGSFNWSLWGSLVLELLIPALYQTLRIYFLGNMPGEWGVNIASQLAWVNLLYEIIQEASILPLYHLLGSCKDDSEELGNRVRTGLLISGGAYAVLSVLIILFARPLCVWMAADVSSIDATVSYIRLESIANTAGIISTFITVLFVTLEKEEYMHILLAIRTALTIMLDTFLISELPFSAHAGVNGIAVSNIIVSLVLILVSFYFLRKEDIRIFSDQKPDLTWLREYGRIGLLSGSESFVRNIAFMLMVSRLVNVISEQGTYWVANSFIWTWLLIPCTAMYDVIKKETAEKENIIKKTPGYIAVSAVLSVLWFVSIPLWKPFIRYVLNAGEYETVFHVVLIQSVFYVIYIFNCICDGTIYGQGKTGYMLAESIFTNGIFYVTMFILWKTGRWIPTLDSIALMFGIGMAIDMIPTLWCYLRLIRDIKNETEQ